MAIKNVGTTITDTQDKSEQVDVMGAMPYQAGIWDETKTYTRNEKAYPVVEWNGQHYRLNRLDVVVGGYNPAQDYADNGMEASWILADQSEMYIIGALFAKFAKLNDFIFSGSKMFSQQGNGNDYTAESFVPNLMLNAKDGSAKFGVLKLDESGMLYIDDGSEIIKFKINAGKLPSLNTLLSGTIFQGDITGDAINNITESMMLPTTLVTEEDSSDVRVETALNVDLTAPASGDCDIYAELYLYWDGMYAGYLGGISEHVKAGKSVTKSLAVDRTMANMREGEYEIFLQINIDREPASYNVAISSYKMSWEFKTPDVQRLEIGLDGLLQFYTEAHWRFTKDGFDLRGKTNMPGVLASGTVNTNGGLMNEWGAKVNYGQTITGGYRIFLKDMTHNQYSVQVTPHTATTFRVSTKTIGYFDILGTGAADFVVFGRNY